MVKKRIKEKSNRSKIYKGKFKETISLIQSVKAGKTMIKDINKGISKVSINKEEVNIKKEERLSRVVKYITFAGVITLVALDANATWDLSKQLGESIVTPIVTAVKAWVAPIIGVAAAGGLALGTQGDLRERAKIAGIGFLGAYGVVEVIKAMSGIGS